jgi:hypothetical protein
MKRLCLRGTMPNNNPLENNTGDKSITSTTVTTDVTAVNIKPSLTNDVTQTEIPDSTNNHQIQDDMDISTHLRSKPLSVENQKTIPQLVSSMPCTMSRVNTRGNPTERLDNYIRLGIQLSTEDSEDDKNYWWNQSQQLVTHPISEPLALESDGCEPINKTKTRRSKIRSFKDSSIQAEQRGALSQASEMWYRYHMKQHRSNQKRIEQRLGIVDDISTTTEIPDSPIVGSHVPLTELQECLQLSVGDAIPTESFQQVLGQVRTAYAAPNDWSDTSLNAQTARISGDLRDYDWNLLHMDEQLYLHHGLEEAILMKEKSLRYLGLPKDQLIAYPQSFPELSS